MPCPHSVKKRFSSLISASSHPLPQTPGFLWYKFWRILPGIFVEDLSGAPPPPVSKKRRHKITRQNPQKKAAFQKKTRFCRKPAPIFLLGTQACTKNRCALECLLFIGLLLEWRPHPRPFCVLPFSCPIMGSQHPSLNVKNPLQLRPANLARHYHIA